jgi:hypothetical protein
VKPVNIIKWVLLFLSVVILATWAQGQDSVPVKIIYAKTKDSTTHYILKMGNEKVTMSCCCKPRKKGETVMIARKDLQFIKPGY